MIGFLKFGHLIGKLKKVLFLLKKNNKNTIEKLQKELLLKLEKKKQELSRHNALLN